MDAVVLAGGSGTRLRPYTISIPKPLVPLGDTPIIEVVLRQLACHGVTRAHLALGHLAELLIAYFSQMKVRPNLDLVYVVEDEPLGTIGPLRALDDLRGTFLALNGDILTTLSYRDLVEFHRRSGCMATMAVKERFTPIDFGVVDLSDSGRIVSHREKPAVSHQIGMGVCVFEPEILEYVPKGRRFDIHDLVEALLGAGEPLAAYVSDAYWMDIGRPGDYAQAQSDFTAEPSRFLPDPG